MDKNSIAVHLKDRPAQLKELRDRGVKIIGYFPGNYVPEELIYASGAVPLCLIHGGNPRSADAALAVLPQVFCPFARAQVGERLSKENPYYNMLDMLVAPITCQHLRKVAEVWEYYGDLKIFKLGVPHQYGNDFEIEYFTNRLRELKDSLQAVTGNEITDKRLSEAIELYNRMRGLIKKISLARRASPLSFRALDFVKLNHASFYADPAFMVEALDSAHREPGEKQPVTDPGRPRILLIGPNIAYGDDKVLELVESAGGDIVIEELCEGIRYYWQDIENEGDLFQSLARGYLTDRVPCAFLRDSARKRFEFALKLIKDFNVSGVIWYELLSCETYNSESYYFAEKLREVNIPMLIIESDYGKADMGQIKTRVDGFIEILRGVV